MSDVDDVEVSALAINVALPEHLRWQDSRRGQAFELSSLTIRLLPSGELAARAYGRPVEGGRGAYTSFPVRESAAIRRLMDDAADAAGLRWAGHRRLTAGSGIERYVLNYGWGHQPAWNVNVESTLLGELSGSRAAVTAVRRWFAEQHPSDRPGEEGRRYHGGSTSELTPAEDDGGDRLTLAIRSGGEDCFDSVAWYAQEVTDRLVLDLTGREASRTSLRWTEVPAG